jgi:cyclase
MRSVTKNVLVLSVAVLALVAIKVAEGQQQVGAALTQQQTEVPLTPGMAFTKDQQTRIESIRKVKDGLYLIAGLGGTSAGNIAIRVTNEGVIIIDDKFEPNFPEIVDKVKTVTSQPIKYVLNTHQHGDHTGSNIHFLKTAEIIMHRNARANMIRLKMPGAGRIVFNDQESLFLGGIEVQMYYFGRGHTNGDAVISFPDLRTVHTGDLVLGGQRQDGTRLLPSIDTTSGGSGKEWVATLDNLLKLDFDTAIPGHGFVMTKDEVRKFRQNFQTLTQRITDAIKSGVKKEELVAKIKTDDLPWGTGGRLKGTLDTLYDEYSAGK